MQANKHGEVRNLFLMAFDFTSKLKRKQPIMFNVLSACGLNINLSAIKRIPVKCKGQAVERKKLFSKCVYKRWGHHQKPAELWEPCWLQTSRGLVGPLMELSLYHCVLCTMFKYELTRQEYIESTREKSQFQQKLHILMVMLRRP